MFKINHNDYNNLILWSSIYSTWWWIPYNIQKQKWNILFSKLKEITIYEKQDLKTNDLICNIYWLWSSWEWDFNIAKQFKKWFMYLKSKFNYNISWIFEAETNIESILFEMWTSLNLNIFDADCTWWRAVPELKYDNFILENKSIFPVIAIDKDLNIYYIKKQVKIAELEIYLRELYLKTKWAIAVIDHIVSVKEAENLLTLWVLKRSLETWSKISFEHSLLNIDWVNFFWRWIVKNIYLKNEGWFLIWYYHITLSSWKSIKIEVKNENMFLYDENGNILIWFPDFIITVYEKGFIWVHNSKITIWDNIVIYKKKAEERWENNKQSLLFNILN